MKSMRAAAIPLCVILSVVLMWSLSLSQETAGELFEKALYLEEAKGELEGALDIYLRILKDFPEDRDAGAKSQLHVGLCYEKLGLEKANRAYQKVIADYPDHREVMTEARTRLAALRAYAAEPVPKKMAVRKVWEGPDVDDFGEISPDGKYLSYVDWDTGNLALYEIATGKKRFLTENGSWDDAYSYALGSRWSPDSKKLAYMWDDSSSEKLCITDFEGSSHRTLCSTDEDVEWYYLSDWTGDGKHILALRQLVDTSFHAVLISVEDGSVDVVGKVDKYEPIEMRMSPDGKYIAYDCPIRKGSEKHDIFLMERESGKSTLLGTHPGHDRVLGWAPDGRHLLFSSDRTGTPTIWAMRILRGRPSGRPIRVKETMGPFMPGGLGATRDGLFYFSQIPNSTDVLVLETDSATGRLVSPPREAINRFVGSNATPDYSPDGKYLAYISRRGALNVQYTFRPVGNVLRIRSLETGAEQEINPGLSRFGFPKWAPDSRTIMVVSFGRDRWTHHLIDTETGDVTLAVESSHPGRIRGHEWAAYGRSVYFIRDEPDANDERSRTIVLRNIDTGLEEELWAGNSRELTTISVSPDGRWLAMLGRGLERALKVMPATGGQPRVVHEFTQVNRLWGWHEWSADGRSILLPKPPPSGDNLKWDIWRIPVDGGEPQRLGVEVPKLWQLSAHPDGRHIALGCQGATDGHPQIWVMENYLPEGGTEAEVRSGSLGEVTGMRLRKVAHVERTVYPRQLGLQGQISPDGRYLSFTDWETGDLALFEVGTGNTHHVTDKGPWEDSSAHAETSIWSRDGKQIAYLWDDYVSPTLCLINADGSHSRVVLQDTSLNWIEPYDWSPDGTSLLTVLYGDDRTASLALVSTIDGSTNRILESTSGSWRRSPVAMRFSPDGERIVYDLRPNNEMRGHDIFIFSIREGKHFPLVTHPADDYLLGWTPDGQEMLFASSRTGTYGLWAIHVEGVQAQGDARLVMPDIGAVSPVGMTSEGTLYYHPPFGNTPDVYTVEYDPTSGQVTTSPVKLETDIEGRSISPDYSPCGRYLAYISGCSYKAIKGGTVISIRSLETGQMQEYHPPLNSFKDLRWSPDGKALYLAAFDEIQELIGIHRFDPREETVVPVVTTRLEEMRGYLLTPDGESILLARQVGSDKAWVWSVTARDLGGGAEKELYRMKGEKLYCFGLSPDGTKLAILSRPRSSTPEVCIRIGPAGGGDLREVCRHAKVARQLAWTADGSHILFSGRSPSSDTYRLWRVAAGGGEPEDLHTEMIGEMRHLTVHPDGKRIAFKAQGPIRNAELWAIENVQE